jgi:F-type H+/Na+-transporting ATPase subunit alpha
LFYAGNRPAVNVGLSVSRVGGAAQVRSMRKISGSLRLDLAQFRELQAFAQFGADLDESTQARLTRGERLTALLIQPENDPLPVGHQVIQIYAGTQGYFDKFPAEETAKIADELVKYVEQSNSELFVKLATEKKFTQETRDMMNQEISAFIKQYAG